MPTELYVHWSHRNFTAGQWREAAKRYLELCQEINRTDDQDRDVDHDKLRDDFIECEFCNLSRNLDWHQREFARAFANLWAIQALNTDDCLRGGGL